MGGLYPFLSKDNTRKEARKIKTGLLLYYYTLLDNTKYIVFFAGVHSLVFHPHSQSLRPHNNYSIFW